VKCDDELGVCRHPSGGFRRAMLQGSFLAGLAVIGPLRSGGLIGAEQDDFTPAGRRELEVDSSQIRRLGRSETSEVEAGKERVESGRQLGDLGEQNSGSSGADNNSRVDRVRMGSTPGLDALKGVGVQVSSFYGIDQRTRQGCSFPVRGGG
jgi:hypothetical protein